MVRQRYPRDLERVVKFHGHFCGGVLIGYHAAKAGLERLGAHRAVDEELIAIVHNDSCAVDAVQVLTGCTFGKGNLFFRDYGKHVYFFALRPSGRAVRVSRKPGRRPPPERLLAAKAEDLFWIEPATIRLPAPARIGESVTCDRCGEPVMITRTRHRGDRTICIPCAQRGERRGTRPPIKRRRRPPDASRA